MTKKEAKKSILGALYTTLFNDLYDLGAGYLVGNTEDDTKRIAAAAEEVLEELKRRST